MIQTLAAPGRGIIGRSEVLRVPPELCCIFVGELKKKIKIFFRNKCFGPDDSCFDSCSKDVRSTEAHNVVRTDDAES